jgi:hypothetical protein
MNGISGSPDYFAASRDLVLVVLRGTDRETGSNEHLK